MYKVLIADDEMLARYSIRTLIAKNFTQLTVVGEAESGRQAIEIADAECPDIIFMDIKMPGINGLEASNTILQKHPETIIIILTAHDNFSYAQKALNEGVQSYLLKPFQKQVVIQTIEEKIALLEARKQKTTLQPELESFLEEEYIAFLVGDNIDPAVEKRIKSLLKRNTDAGFFAIVGNEDMSLLEIKQAKKILQNRVRCFSSERFGKKIVFFIPQESLQVSQQVNLEEKHISAQTLFEAYAGDLRKTFNKTIPCGVGTVFPERKGLEQSFYQAVSAWEAAKASGGFLIYSGEELTGAVPVPQYPAAKETELLEKLQARDYTGWEPLLEEIALLLTAPDDIEVIREFAAQFLIALRRLFQLTGFPDTREVLEFPVAGLFAMSAKSEIKLCIISTGRQVISRLQGLEVDSGWWLEKAFAYIRKHVYTDISLDSIAENIQVSPQHLSRLFKAEYGKTIGEYIKEQRISYAKYLLINSDYPVKEICFKIGYSDQNYFARVFKQVTGHQPTAYRGRGY